MGLSEKELDTINETVEVESVDKEQEIKDSNTEVSEKTNDNIKNVSIKLISKMNLSEEHQKIVLSIYDDVKKSIETFINDPNINISVKITKILGQIIKKLETTHIYGKIISGTDKKIVAINLGRSLIKDAMPDNKGEKEALMLYDMIAEPTLETMIDVSKVVNVFVKEIATKCCPSFMDFLKHIKSYK